MALQSHHMVVGALALCWKAWNSASQRGYGYQAIYRCGTGSGPTCMRDAVAVAILLVEGDPVVDGEIREWKGWRSQHLWLAWPSLCCNYARSHGLGGGCMACTTV